MSDLQAVPSVELSVRVRRPERRQVAMVVECLDDLVSATHPVRMVWAVVRKLNLKQFQAPIRAREGHAGRDATDPALLVALWLYATIRGIGSARELARRCLDSDPFRWLLGGVTVNHRLLSEFRTDHGTALDDLLTQIIASLVDQQIVKVSRISQDGVRIRISAGASSFRRKDRLNDLLQQAREHVQTLREQVDSPATKALSARQKAARKRAAEEKLQRLEAAIQQLPEMEKRQAEAAQRAGNGTSGQRIRAREPRVSTTDPEARVLKMPNGGFNPAVNIQLAADTHSRAILAVTVTNQGSDSANLSQPMRQQVQQRTGGTVQEHLIDGGYLRTEDIETAHNTAVALFVPPKPARQPGNRGRELEPKPTDSPAILAWKRRMTSDEGKEIYKQRAATSETINADLRTYRGLTQIPVRGLVKAKSVALWCAIAYNILHFGPALLA